MKSNQQKNERDENIEVLKWLLGQRFRAQKRKVQLERRLQSICRERNAPIGGQGYSPLPRSGGESEGAASITMKMADIEDRIYAQKESVDKAIVRVMDILEYLPENSLEREICELRHIDMRQWKDIQDEIPMSRSQVYKRYMSALRQLLQNRRIQRMVEENAEAYSTWKFENEMRRVRNGAKKNIPPISAGGKGPGISAGEKTGKNKNRQVENHANAPGRKRAGKGGVKPSGKSDAAQQDPEELNARDV